MPFRFDRRQAAAPVKVSWHIKAVTMAVLEEMAREEGVKVEQVAQQILDHVVGQRPRRRQG
jgi:hypothetical protein